MPPPVQQNYNSLVHSNAPVESYQAPWTTNSRKGVIDTYSEPGKSYSTIFRPVLSSTIYTYNHHYKYPGGNEGKYLWFSVHSTVSLKIRFKLALQLNFSIQIFVKNVDTSIGKYLKTSILVYSS